MQQQQYLMLTVHVFKKPLDPVLVSGSQLKKKTSAGPDLNLILDENVNLCDNRDSSELLTR